MTIKTDLINARQIGNKLADLMEAYDEFYWAVAWGSNGPLADKLVAHRRKIKSVLIGTHFSQTEPELLERLMKVKGARRAASTGSGTFHPKMYFFQSGERAAAIIGSANFTRAGVTENTEAALYIEGLATDKPLSGIRQMVTTLWSNGEEIKADWLNAYKLQYAASRRYKHALTRPVKIPQPKTGARNPDLLSMSWSEYVRRIRSGGEDKLESRIDMLRQIQAMFNSVDAFSELELDQRKAIAGVVKDNEKLGNGLDEYDWGWFGSMYAVGALRTTIGKNSVHLSRALDCIHSAGDVSYEQYEEFIRHFVRAFASEKRSGKSATASRLLSMKRPDTFLCTNSRNLDGISTDLGFAKSTVTFEKYWENVVEPIVQAKWWQAKRPSGIEGRIWDARAAMLDMLYYTGPQP